MLSFGFFFIGKPYEFLIYSFCQFIKNLRSGGGQSIYLCSCLFFFGGTAALAAVFLTENISTYKCETNFKQKRKTFLLHWQSQGK